MLGKIKRLRRIVNGWRVSALSKKDNQNGIVENWGIFQVAR
jgi:hypothetical protein